MNRRILILTLGALLLPLCAAAQITVALPIPATVAASASSNYTASSNLLALPQTRFLGVQPSFTLSTNTANSSNVTFTLRGSLNATNWLALTNLTVAASDTNRVSGYAFLDAQAFTWLSCEVTNLNTNGITDLTVHVSRKPGL